MINKRIDIYCRVSFYAVDTFHRKFYKKYLINQTYIPAIHILSFPLIHVPRLTYTRLHVQSEQLFSFFYTIFYDHSSRLLPFSFFHFFLDFIVLTFFDFPHCLLYSGVHYHIFLNNLVSSIICRWFCQDSSQNRLLLIILYK